jgi:hypothetical protein
VAADGNRDRDEIESESAKEKAGRNRPGRVVLARVAEGRGDRVAVGAQGDNEAGDDERKSSEAESRRLP